MKQARSLLGMFLFQWLKRNAKILNVSDTGPKYLTFLLFRGAVLYHVQPQLQRNW